MTNRKKDLFALFRESQYKLDERPSPAAWRKLEKRLNKRNRGGSIQIIRLLSMAAALVFLVGILYVFSFSIEKNAEAPIAMEDLEYSDNDAQLYKTVVEFQKQMKSRGANPAKINEGPKGKKLVVIKIQKEKSADFEKGKTKKDSLKNDKGVGE